MANSVISSSYTLRNACHGRGGRTRHRLIEVAVEVFADLGYEGASTRKIAELAETNLVAIPYYFGSKLGLYHAAAEYIGSNLAERFSPACERARKALQGSSAREQTLHTLTEFVIELAEIVLGSDIASSWALFAMREQFHPTTAFEVLHVKFERLLDVGFDCVARLIDRPAGALETRMQFFGILALVKFTLVDRATLLRNTGWKSVGNDEVKIVTDMLRRTVQALFAGSPS